MKPLSTCLGYIMFHAYLLACPLQKKVLQKDEEEKSEPKQPLIGMLQPLLMGLKKNILVWEDFFLVWVQYCIQEPFLGKGVPYQRGPHFRGVPFDLV